MFGKKEKKKHPAINSYHRSYRQIKQTAKRIHPLFFSAVTSLSLQASSPCLFTPLLSLSAESKPDLIFAEGVLDDLRNRNTAGCRVCPANP